MGADIVWRAFDDAEVEQMWRSYPLGELISLVEGDKLFQMKDRGILPEESEHRKEYGLQADILEGHLKTIGKEANLSRTADWNVRNGLADHITQTDLLDLDRAFIIYFTYADYDGDYASVAGATTAVYKAQGLPFDEEHLLEETMKPRWLAMMKNADRVLIAEGLADYSRKLYPGRRRDRAAKAEFDDAAEVLQECFSWVDTVFRLAHEHGLETYVEANLGDYERFCGVGPTNVVTRFRKRFDNTRFSTYA
jgi:hypothetical protein